LVSSIIEGGADPAATWSYELKFDDYRAIGAKAAHWYFTGQGQITMALSAVFSAMEVVPLRLLTLGVWDFVTLTRLVALPHGRDLETRIVSDQSSDPWLLFTAFGDLSSHNE
jgi:hypothetical protein